MIPCTTDGPESARHVLAQQRAAAINNNATDDLEYDLVVVAPLTMDK